MRLTIPFQDRHIYSLFESVLPDLVLAFVMYQSIRRIGGSWAGAAITLGASILVAQLLGLTVPIDPEIMNTVATVALIVGVLTFISRTHGGTINIPHQPADLRDIRHDMTDLYRGRQLSNQLTGRMRNLRRQASALHKRPQDAGNILRQLKRMLPAIVRKATQRVKEVARN